MITITAHMIGAKGIDIQHQYPHISQQLLSDMKFLSLLSL